MRDQTAKAAQDDMDTAVGRVLEVFSQARDDDPLVAMCRALVAGSSSFRFVAFVRADEEVLYVPCAQPDCRVPIVPVDVERAFVRFLKDEVAALDVAFLREERRLPFLDEIGRIGGLRRQGRRNGVRHAGGGVCLSSRGGRGRHDAWRLVLPRQPPLSDGVWHAVVRDGRKHLC